MLNPRVRTGTCGELVQGSPVLSVEDPVGLPDRSAGDAQGLESIQVPSNSEPLSVCTATLRGSMPMALRWRRKRPMDTQAAVLESLSAKPRDRVPVRTSRMVYS